MLTKSDQSLSKIPDHPLLEAGTRPVKDFEVGGTAPASESLESEVVAQILLV